jgi:hypothetical protein
MAFNWTCPYCNRDQSVVDSHHQHSRDDVKFYAGADGRLTTTTQAMLCANPDCTRTTIELSIMPVASNAAGWYIPTGAVPIYRERVMPRGGAKPQPDYIPQVIRADYVEACLIKDLSPKASATLSRRCLQGMIRGFAKISRARLIDEIKALKAAVDDGTAPRSITIESVDAIDHVRGIGNIGAHMERDIDVIVDVDPAEAGLLIELIELLFREWYVEQYNREQRLAKITSLGEAKQQQIIDARAGQQALAAPDRA